jgi:hypothetical protein
LVFCFKEHLSSNFPHIKQQQEQEVNEDSDSSRIQSEDFAGLSGAQAIQDYGPQISLYRSSVPDPQVISKNIVAEKQRIMPDKHKTSWGKFLRPTQRQRKSAAAQQYNKQTQGYKTVEDLQQSTLSSNSTVPLDVDTESREMFSRSVNIFGCL